MKYSHATLRICMLLLVVFAFTPVTLGSDEPAAETAPDAAESPDATPADADPADADPADGESGIEDSAEKTEKEPPKKLGAKNLSVGGWILMLLSVTIVTSMLIWCIYKVIVTPESTQHLHTQADIEPPDIHDEEEQ